MTTDQNRKLFFTREEVLAVGERGAEGLAVGKRGGGQVSSQGEEILYSRSFPASCVRVYRLFYDRISKSY